VNLHRKKRKKKLGWHTRQHGKKKTYVVGNFRQVDTRIQGKKGDGERKKLHKGHFVGY